MIETKNELYESKLKEIREFQEDMDKKSKSKFSKFKLYMSETNEMLKKHSSLLIKLETNIIKP